MVAMRYDLSEVKQARLIRSMSPASSPGVAARPPGGATKSVGARTGQGDGVVSQLQKPQTG